MSAAASNRAVVIHGARDVRVEDRPMPRPAGDDVVVAVHLGGICGSDLSYYRSGAVGDFRVVQPMVLGHEIVGTVCDAGSTASRFHEGSRVVVDPSSPCRGCARCLEGRRNVCDQPRFLGSASTNPHTDGGFMSFVTTSAANLVAVPTTVPSSAAVFAEPLAVAVHAVNRAGGVRGARILVIGAGPMGNIIVALARRLGADEIVVTDLEPSRLERASLVGADTTVLAGAEDAGRGFDLVIEASGSGAGIADSLARVRRAGRVVLVGLPNCGPVPVPIALVVPNETDVIGSFRFDHDEFVDAVDLISSGLDLSPLHTATTAASDAPIAFELACERTTMKVQLDFGSLV